MRTNLARALLVLLAQPAFFATSGAQQGLPVPNQPPGAQSWQIGPRRTPNGYAPGQLGDLCYTGRGSCVMQRPAPMGSRCDCALPGFGWRKGVVQP
jgi:hypothetical protein